MNGDWTEEKLKQLHQARLKDKKQATTRRHRAVANSPNKCSALLTQLFAKDPVALRRLEETQALMAWPKYVGTTVAAVSEALRVRDRTLIVRVQDSLWMQQLSFIKSQILSKYRRDFPKLSLNEIYFTTRT